MNQKRFFFDTEFHATDGHPVQIFPISIGIVSEDGRTLYVEFEGARTAANATEWLKGNVLPHLTGEELPIATIKEQVVDFIGKEECEFLAKYGAYDWVVLCQVFGCLMGIPENWPCHYTETVPLDLPKLATEGAEHNALADALTLRKAYYTKFPK